MTTRGFVQAMMRAGGTGPPIACVIRGPRRIRVSELPKAGLGAEAPLRPTAILERPGARATVVSDLLGYFRDVSVFRRYRICCSLRSKIDDVLSKRAKSSATVDFRQWSWWPLWRRSATSELSVTMN